MSNLEQLNDNISYMKKFKPLTQEENDFLIKLGDQIRTSIAIPCTACNYCTPGCPEHICIPEYFNLFNKRKQNLSKGKSTEYDDLKMNTESHTIVLNVDNVSVYVHKSFQLSVI